MRTQRLWLRLILVLSVSLLVPRRNWINADSVVIVTPTWSQIEDGLYLGGFVEKPPPGTRAVLNVSKTKNSYRVEFSRFAPIRDFGPAPGIDWLRQQVKFVDVHRRAGRSVYVHCAVGISRSGMVVVAYLMQRDGLSRDAAMKSVQSKREMVKPNPAFMELLSQWEKEVKKGKPAP